MFRVIYKSELFYAFDMTDRYYIVRNNRGRPIYLPKQDCEVV